MDTLQGEAGLASPSSSASQPASSGRLLAVLPPALVVFVTALVYAPSLFNGWVDYDDPRNLMQNFHFRGLGRSQLLWMFRASLPAA